MTFAWKKWTIRLVDLLLLVYLGFAVSSFNNPADQASVCTQVNIEMKDGNTDGFMDAKELKELLQEKKLYPLNRPMRYIDVRRLEAEIKKCAFINDVQCYKTQDGHVCINVEQQLPVLRIKSQNGEDYYIDREGRVMRNEKYSSDLIVATGSISQDYARKVLAPLALIINGDALWSNQIVQIYVRPSGNIVLVPRVGDHIIELGKAENVREKLDRLDLFYRKGLNRVGWDRYEKISVEFKNQIICTKKKI